MGSEGSGIPGASVLNTPVDSIVAHQTMIKWQQKVLIKFMKKSRISAI